MSTSPAKLDFCLTPPKSATSKFLIDNFCVLLRQTPPKSTIGFTRGTALATDYSLALTQEAPSLSNRHIPELESLVSHRKQRIGPSSNRHKIAFSSFHLQRAKRAESSGASLCSSLVTRHSSLFSGIIAAPRNTTPCPSTNTFATNARPATRRSSPPATARPPAPSAAASAQRSSSPPSPLTPATARQLRAALPPSPPPVLARVVVRPIPAAATESCLPREVPLASRLFGVLVSPVLIRNQNNLSKGESHARR